MLYVITAAHKHSQHQRSYQYVANILGLFERISETPQDATYASILLRV